jgi:hypothetical protein
MGQLTIDRRIKEVASSVTRKRSQRHRAKPVCGVRRIASKPKVGPDAVRLLGATATRARALDLEINLNGPGRARPGTSASTTMNEPSGGRCAFEYTKEDERTPYSNATHDKGAKARMNRAPIYKEKAI